MMNKRTEPLTEVQGIVDELGRIMLPPSFVKKERLEPGSSLEVFAYRNGNILVVPYLEDSGGDSDPDRLVGVIRCVDEQYRFVVPVDYRHRVCLGAGDRVTLTVRQDGSCLVERLA